MQQQEGDFKAESDKKTPKKIAALSRDYLSKKEIATVSIYQLNND